MSAALVIAATELFDQFSYVGGKQREKGGLGVALDGKERVHYQGNPWSDLAIREVERARDLWAGCQFEAAASVLRGVASRVPNRLRFETIASLSEAVAARHRLDFREALKSLGNVQRSAVPLFDGRNDHRLLNLVSKSIAVCTACSKDTASDIFLRELLDNTLRTAAQGRYEDAAARLYRAMEMQGQLWLSAATAGAFVNGRCKAADAASLTEAVRSLPFCQPDEHGEIKFSLEQLFFALGALGHKQGNAITADCALGTQSLWRRATRERNSSILAHGVQPIGASGFTQMKQLTSEFLDFDLNRETNPIPSLDPRWLE
jgi:CRISPR-associated protein (TIGR02710 family)